MSFFGRFFSAFDSSQPGFIFMWILVLILFGAIYLVLRRATFLKSSSNLNVPLFMNKIKQLLVDKNPGDAVKLCDSAGKRALPWIVKGAILKAEIEPRAVRSLIEERVVSIIPRLEKHLVYIATVGNISTMVGLMGTIYGLILSFAAVGSPDIEPAMKSALLADGISAAMNTTLFGLIISVPCILFYTSFRAKVDEIVASIDLHVITLIKLLVPEEKIMKSYKPSQRKTQETVETEPDMTPIMGLMVVLIPLLLSSAEFVKIGRATVNLPQAAQVSENDDEEKKAPPKTLSLGIVISEKGISLMHTLKDKKGKKGKQKKVNKDKDAEKKEPEIPLKDGSQNYDELKKQLIKIKRELLAEITGEKKSSSYRKIYKKYRKLTKSTELYDYKDLYNVKILADKKISYQTVITIMDVARKFKDKSDKKYSLFPNVSMGVMR